MNALWAGIAATVTLGAVAGETAAALKVENQTKRREAEQFKKAFDRLVELQKQGDISTEELLHRVLVLTLGNQYKKPQQKGLWLYSKELMLH